MALRTALQRVPRDALGGILVAFVIVVVPLSMLAGMAWPPAETYGPNAALSLWLPLAVTGIAIAYAINGRRTRSALQFASPYAAAFALGVLSLLWSPNRAEGLRVLVHMAAPLAVYLAIWNVSRLDVASALVRSLAAMALMTVGVLFVFAWVFDAMKVTDLGRLMGIVTLALPPLFIMATLGRRSQTAVLLLGATALFIALAADARMVVVVLGLLVVTSPALHLTGLARVGLGAAGLVIVLGAASLNAFDGRLLLFNRGGSVSNVLESGTGLLGDRPEVWGSLIERCDGSWLLGNGVGSASTWSAEIIRNFPEPHNAFVQTFCDIGLVGSGLLWWFFIAAGIRSARVIRGSEGDAAFATASLQLLGALLLLSLTDIPLTASAQFLMLVAIVLASADATMPSQAPPFRAISWSSLISRR